MAGHESSVAPGRRQRWLAAREQERSRRRERWAVENYDMVVVPSADDAAALPGPSGVVPNGVDVERFRMAPLPTESRIVMTAAFYTGPNVDGAVWFCQEVLPLVAAQVPDVTVELVGRAPVPAVARLASEPRVVLHPDVPDTLPYLERAALAVVPLRIGSGTRLKALEAMAVGRPVIGTTIGLAGLGLRHEEHALFADTAPEMARQIVAVLRDTEMARALAERARRYVEAHFDWRRIGDRFVGLALGDDVSS
jgi:glycosyltransferase involved in cell wall biosynthesis